MAALHLPNFNNSTMPCCLCKASLTGPMSWSNFKATAPWRTTMWSRASWNAWTERSKHALFGVAGSWVGVIHLDYMHCKYLGTDMVQFGSILALLVLFVMPDTPEINLASCWRFIKEWYRVHQTQMRYRSLTRLTMFLRKKAGPKLRGKAGEIRHFGEPLLALCKKRANKDDILHKKITLLLKFNVAMEAHITQHKDDTAFPDAAAQQFQSACENMLLLHADLAQIFAGHGMDYFSLTSKTHMLQHVAMLSACLSPRQVPWETF